MTERQHLAEAQAAWELGLNIVVNFGCSILARVGIRLDPNSLEATIYHRDRQRLYQKFLVPEGDDEPFPFAVEENLVGPAATELVVVYHCLVKHLRPLEPYFEQLPGAGLEGDVSGDWEEPEPVYHADRVNPWMLLGCGNACGFSTADAIVEYLVSFMFVRGRGRERPDWIIGRLDVMRKHVAEWRALFCDLDLRLPHDQESPTLAVKVNIEHRTVELSGDAILVDSHEQILVVFELASRPGQWVSSSDMGRRHPQLQDVRIDRIIPKLPVALRKQIESSGGKGYRWRSFENGMPPMH